MPRTFAVKPDVPLRHSLFAGGIFLLVLLICAVVSVAVYFRLLDSEERRAIANLNHLADMQAAAVSAWVNERLSDAQVFSSGRFLGASVNAWLLDGGMESEIRQRMQDQLKAIKSTYDYRLAAIIDTRGNTLLSAGNELVPIDDAAAAAIGNAVVGDSITVSAVRRLGGDGGTWTVDIVAPLHATGDDDGSAASLLLLRSDARLYPRNRMPTSALLNAETGVLLAEIRNGQVVRTLDNGQARYFGNQQTLPLTPDRLLAAVESKGGSVSLPMSQGPEAVATARKIDSAPWYLLTLVDHGVIRAGAWQLAWLVAAATAAVLALTGLVLLLWWKKKQGEFRLASLRAEADIQLLQRQYDYLAKYANDLIVVTDGEGRIIELNDKASQVLGGARQELVGIALSDLFPQTFRNKLRGVLAQLRDSGKALFEFLLQHPEGSIPLEISARSIELDGRHYTQFVGRDISERRDSEAALRESRERLNAIMDSIPDVVWSLAGDLSQLRYINRAVEVVFGYSAAEFMDNPRLWFELIHEDDRQRIQKVLDGLDLQHPMCELEHRIIHRDGSLRWLNVHGRLVSGAYGTPLRIDGVTTDITRRKTAELQVQLLAYYDSVTGLPNRALLNDRLAQAIHIAARNRKKLAVMFMDLDNFKNINDSLGHHIGDMLLQAIAEYLRQCVREEDTIGRIGGDEFIVILPDLERGEQAVTVAEKILAVAARPYLLQGQQVHTSISIGISVFPEDGAEAFELIKHADSALYQAKGQGRNNYQFFTRELNQQIRRNSAIERRLRHAIEADELALWYQPQVDTSSGRMIGAEALLRWRSTDQEALSPVEFVPVAEERGLIGVIGEWALREACRQSRAWQDEGLQMVPIAVNVSPIQFQRKGFAGLVTGILEDVGLEARYLELEITESAIMRRAPLVAELANTLRDAGVGISIDDFGTGYSSLSYLKQIPIDKIKIDRSFISDMLNDADDEAIAVAIINLARSLNLRVLAEGVESREQLERLRDFGCSEVQGYYYSSAVSAEDFRRFLEDESVFRECV